MSLYKSKGLTARLVIIAGCVAGILPSLDTHDPPLEQERQRQEQRRLFYVGITRSTETLVLNSSIRMPLAMAYVMRMPLLAKQGGDAILQASPLMSELGPSAPAVMAVFWTFVAKPVNICRKGSCFPDPGASRRGRSH